MDLTVKGMHCKSCATIVKEALEDIGAKNVTVHVDEKKQIGKVSLEYANKTKAVVAIKNEGYTVI